MNANRSLTHTIEVFTDTIQLWTNLGLSQDVVVHRLFELEYPVVTKLTSPDIATASSENALGTYLYSAVLRKGCPYLTNYISDDMPLNENEISAFKAAVDQAGFAELGKVVTDHELLRDMLRIICNL